MTTYPITEIFHTSQGEGLNAGRNAWFIRLGGCNYACPGCDEILHKDPNAITKMTASEIVDQIVNDPSDIVVITGGEPTLYDLTDLCNEINLRCLPTDKLDWPKQRMWPNSSLPGAPGPLICIETNGTGPIRGNIDFICVSPKPLEFARATASYQLDTLSKANEIKLVVGWVRGIEGDFDTVVQWFKTKSPNAQILFSPLTTYPEGGIVKESAELTMKYHMKYRDSRISLQWHKWLKIR